ncbi:MAG: hypothetical protein HWE25_10935 [Alphaproteobacteria bacterium]|nr:hypothetical protein [Alphaproteobacteria bacterium]
MLSRKIFVAMAAWAGGWTALRIASYFIGTLSFAALGQSEHLKYLKSVVSLPVFSGAIVLLLIHHFWQGFRWKTILSFMMFDLVSFAAGAWLQYEKYIEVARAAARGTRGGLSVSGQEPELFNLVFEPVLYNAAGYVLGCALVLVLFKKKHLIAVDLEEQRQDQFVNGKSVVSVFSTFALLTFISGLPTTIAHAGMMSLDISIPFAQAKNGILYALALSLLWTSIWFWLGGKTFNSWYGPASMNVVLCSSVLFGAVQIGSSIVPYLMAPSGQMAFLWQAILNSLGLASLLILAHSIFFWLGARARSGKGA